MQRPVQKLGLIAAMMMAVNERSLIAGEYQPQMRRHTFGAPIFDGKQMRKKHFNKKRHGKMLKRKHKSQ